VIYIMINKITLINLQTEIGVNLLLTRGIGGKRSGQFFHVVWVKKEGKNREKKERREER